jgi:hypothetical protein
LLHGISIIDLPCVHILSVVLDLMLHVGNGNVLLEVVIRRGGHGWAVSKKKDSGEECAAARKPDRKDAYCDGSNLGSARDGRW